MQQVIRIYRLMLSPTSVTHLFFYQLYISLITKIKQYKEAYISSQVVLCKQKTQKQLFIKSFLLNLILIQTWVVKNFLSPSIVHYLFRQHNLFIIIFYTICTLYCNVFIKIVLQSCGIFQKSLGYTQLILVVVFLKFLYISINFATFFHSI